jgi:hypothetical protein
MAGGNGLKGFEGRGGIGLDRRAKGGFELRLRGIGGRRLQPESAGGSLAARRQGEKQQRGRDNRGGRAYGGHLPIVDV